jgi:hypothetical protein
MILDPSTAAKLAKVCRLFASDKIGERAAAAAMADKLLRSCRLTWPQVFAAHIVPPDGIAAKVAFVADNLDCLDPWQRGFVQSIRGHRSLSEKQRGKLDEIVANVRASRAEAAA